MKTIYQGGLHYVTCDGAFHTAHAPYFGPPEVQCKCFCRDPEYAANGFTSDIWDRYLVAWAQAEREDADDRRSGVD